MAIMAAQKRAENPPTKRQLKALRERMGKTQAEMAELVGVTWRTWNGYERGDRHLSQAVSLLIRRLIQENP